MTSQLETFDDFLSSDVVTESTNTVPFQFRDNQNDEEETLKWLVNDLDTKIRKAESRLRTYRRYWAYYKGVHWQFNSSRGIDGEENTQEKKPRMKVNFVYEMVEGRISQLTENKIAIVAMPQNGDDQKDVNNARSCKILLDAWADKYDMDGLQEEAERIKAVTGTVFHYGYYDFDKGPIHPGMEEVKKKLEATGVKSDPQFPILDAKGKKTKKNYKGEVRVGEACLENFGPDQVFLELEKESFEKCNEFTMIEYVHRKELAAEYPKHAADLETATCDDFRYDLDTMEIYKSDNMLRKATFWHKKTKYLPQGAKIVFVNDKILEITAHPLKEGELPLKVDYDIKVAREPYGRSFISNIEQMQDLYNSIRSGIARDVKVGAMPKWAVPKGSVKISSLSNEFTIMEYTGAKAPEIIHNPPISDKLLGLEDKLEKQISQHSSLFDISRGIVPTGVTANSALRFLDEQEDRRVAPLKKKRRKRIVEAYRLLVSIMGEYYSADDGRTARILGKANEYLIKSFKQADFTQIYDIKLQQSSSLPDTKTGKISMIVDMNAVTQDDPVFKKEEIVEIMDMANDERFISGATVATRAAQEIMDLIYDEEFDKVPEPETYDNNIVHWNVFYKAIQALSFRTRVPKETRKFLITRMTTIEGLMYAQAKKNGKYLQALMTIPEYPLFYVPEMPLHDLAMMMMQGQVGVTETAMAQGGGDTSKVQNITKQQGEVNATE
jgi:hypothetical protein